MLVNSANLDSLRVGFKTSFQKGLGIASSQYLRIATEVPSSSKEEKYGWLGKLPKVREWIGARAVQNLQQYDYSIKNRSFELTIGVDRDDIEDDNLGIYAPLFEEMGRSTGAHPDDLCFSLLKAGFDTNCYDGQFFFDTDHPVLDKKGNPQPVANTDGGAGAPWFLMDASRALKPIIFQKRKEFQFVAKDAPTDENVFNKKEFVYGSDGRNNAGFGFWQFCWGSKQTLNSANYGIARAAISGMKGDYEQPLGLTPNLLVVGPAGESAGRKLVNSELGTGGETNEWKGTAELLVVPWLA
ncbi:MAG: Mu-like prophage major head subunit gpT family protein [Afipia sp.]